MSRFCSSEKKRHKPYLLCQIDNRVYGRGCGKCAGKWLGLKLKNKNRWVCIAFGSVVLKFTDHLQIRDEVSEEVRKHEKLISDAEYEAEKRDGSFAEAESAADAALEAEQEARTELEAAQESKVVVKARFDNIKQIANKSQVA